MSASLEELFDQILHSEQTAQDRKNKIHDVKVQWTSCVEQISKSDKELEALKQEITTKQQRLCDIEIDVKISAAHVDVTRREKARQTEILQSSRQKLTSVKDENKRCARQFCEEAARFVTRHGLCSGGSTVREQSAAKTLQELGAEMSVLQTELGGLREKDTQLKALLADKQQAEEQMITLRKSLLEKKQCIQSEREITTQLEKEKHRVVELPRTDPDFKRLRQELDGCRSEFDETRCKKLQRELQQLEQNSWQRELRRKREQQQQDQASYRRWQQHQQQADPTDEKADSTESIRANVRRFTNFAPSSTQLAPSGGTSSMQKRSVTKPPNLAKLTDAINCSKVPRLEEDAQSS